jgi:hypothetical protein
MQPSHLTVDVAACYSKPNAASTSLLVSHDKPYTIKDFVSHAGTSPASPKAPPPSRTASMEARETPLAPKPPTRFVSFELITEPLKVTHRDAVYDVLKKDGSILNGGVIDNELAVRILKDLSLTGGGLVDVEDLQHTFMGVATFKKHLRSVLKPRVCDPFLASMGDPVGSPPPQVLVPEELATSPVSPSYSPTSPPPEAYAAFFHGKLMKEQDKVREAGEAYARLEQCLAHERVTAGLLRAECFNKLLAYAKAAAKPAPPTGRKRPASALM